VPPERETETVVELPEVTVCGWNEKLEIDTGVDAVRAKPPVSPGRGVRPKLPTTDPTRISAIASEMGTTLLVGAGRTSDRNTW